MTGASAARRRRPGAPVERREQPVQLLARFLAIQALGQLDDMAGECVERKAGRFEPREVNDVLRVVFFQGHGQLLGARLGWRRAGVVGAVGGGS